MKTISTYINSRDGKVNLVFHVSGVRMMLSTPLSSPVKFRGTDVPRSVPGYRSMTITLRRLYSDCEEFILLHPKLRPDEMKRSLKAIIEGSDPDCASSESLLLVDLLRKYADLKKAPNTRKLYWGTSRNVERFDAHASLRSVDANWLARYVSHEESKPLRSSVSRAVADGRKIRKGRKTNGIGIDLRNIRAVFNWAITNEWTDRYPFRRFKIRYEPTRKRNLPVECCRRLLHIGNRYTDMFILMVYLLGININDLYYMPKDCIKDGRLEYRRNKTGRFFSIKVEREAQDLLERYAGEGYLLRFAESCGDYKVFLKHMNEELKKHHAGCTSYWSRHTWASLASYLDVPIETISAALDHSVGASVTNIYINWDYRKVDEANRRVIDCLVYGKKR